PVSLRNGVFVVVIALQFVLVLVNGSTTMALPSIRDGLGATNSELQWYASLFALTFSLVLVLSGRLGDLFGTRRLLMIGFGALLASWALSAASPNIYFLLVARALQGIAGGVTAPQLSAMIQRTFNGHTRTRAFSIFLMFAGAGFMIGQLSAGALTNANLFGIGWRWAYLPFIPIGLVVWLIAAKVLPATRPGTAGRLDVTGAAVLAVVAFFLMFPLIQGRNAGWPVWILLMLVCTLPLFFAFIHYEKNLVRKGGDPLVNPILFAIRSFRIGNIITLLVGLLSAAGPIYLILTIQLGFDIDPLRAAILTCPMPFANMFGSMAAAPLLRRYGRGAVVIGALLNALSAVVVLYVARVGSSEFEAVTTIAFVLSEVPHEYAGAASGVQATGLQLAGAIGIAVIGLAYWGRIGGSEAESAYLDGIKAVMWITIGLAAVQAALVLLLPKHNPGPDEEFRLADPELLVMPDLHGDNV
ncbi:MAG: MFS transporter, partial [Actinobacteria bacterium]|nr:MFS transporter [Actinomycetota bacterium]